MILRRSLWRICVVLSVFFLLLWGVYEFRRRSPDGYKLPFRKLPLNKLPFHLGKSPDVETIDIDTDNIESSLPPHPIDELLTDAEKAYNTLRSRETHDVTSAAAVYRRQRGRHPPPNFDRWVEFAKKHNALLIEDLFDQIYHDLEPFWALDPKTLQSSVAGLEYVVSIRNGTMTTTESHDGHAGIGMWSDMFEQLKDNLPDVDIAFNVIDEPRLLVPWDFIDGYMKIAKTKGRLSSNGSFPRVTEFYNLPDYEKQYFGHNWITSGSYWVLARDTCPPDTPARRAEATSDFMVPPEFPPMWPYGSHDGYVSNWTTAKDPCSHPHLRSMHGTFIAPKQIKTSKDLFPVFGGSKLAMNNDILLPPAEYWTEANADKPDESKWWEYLGGVSDKWETKENKVFWRGPATGGENKRETWTHFHRHRLVSMMNSTQVHAAQTDGFLPQNFPLPSDRRHYESRAALNSSLSKWLGKFADGAFTELMCYERRGNSTSCAYNGEYYKVANIEDMWEQLAYKYLPDVDGDAFSAQFLALLRSSSLPVKATIYSEWHDSRLVPWKHFVPMDNTFVDFWGVLDYFWSGRDATAKKIAEEGKQWADTVLRKEDMLVYTYRLVLEYARIMDNKREKMGFVGDLRRA